MALNLENDFPPIFWFIWCSLLIHKELSKKIERIVRLILCLFTILRWLLGIPEDWVIIANNLHLYQWKLVPEADERNLLNRMSREGEKVTDWIQYLLEQWTAEPLSKQEKFSLFLKKIKHFSFRRIGHYLVHKWSETI